MNKSERSPAQPRPPPNTPFSSLHSREQALSSQAARSSSMTTPPSPTSPQLHVRSLSHQQTRSIPLARLIQRRLSSVPEEDSGSPVADGYVNSSGFFKHPRARSLSTGNPSPVTSRSPHVHFLLSPPSPLPRDLQNSSPVRNMLLPQSTLAEGDLGFQQERATVKLPGTTAKSVTGSVNPGNTTSSSTRKGESNYRHQEGSGRDHDNTRGRGQKRGVRGRRGKGTDGGMRITNGPERIDGGLVVKS